MAEKFFFFHTVSESFFGTLIPQKGCGFKAIFSAFLFRAKEAALLNKLYLPKIRSDFDPNKTFTYWYFTTLKTCVYLRSIFHIPLLADSSSTNVKAPYYMH